MDVDDALALLRARAWTEDRMITDLAADGMARRVRFDRPGAAGTTPEEAP